MLGNTGYMELVGEDRTGSRITRLQATANEGDTVIQLEANK